VIASLIVFFAPVRAFTWWEFKTSVFLGIAYLAAYVVGVPFSEAWPAFVACVLAIIPLASYVCVINDITDERDDRRAGKTNTMEGKSLFYKAGWITACVLGGLLAFLLCFSGNLPAALLYVANWIVFTLYSVPPLRLKVRGAAGVLADACGGTALPTLWCVLLVDPSAQTPFLVAVGAWAFAFGVRGILYHQAGDFLADQAVGVRTLAVELGLSNLRKLVRLFVFPVELVALAALLWMGRSAFVLPIAAIYLISQVLLWKRCGIVSVAVLPRPDCRFALMKYYQLWLPLTFILALSLHDLRYLALLPVQLVLFPDCWRRIGYHVRQICSSPATIKHDRSPV
jgi:4-hydroxybenzoate polyprenyltransferase